MRCLYTVLGEIADERLTSTAALDRFDEEWDRNGPTEEHPYTGLYKSRGQQAVARAAATVAGLAADGATVMHRQQIIELGDGYAATITPDALVIAEDHQTVRVQRWLTGGPSESRKDDKVHGLLYLAAKLAVPGAEPVVEIRYVARDLDAVPVFTKTKTGEPTPPSEKVIENRRTYYREAAAGIVAGRFAPKPDDYSCPRCPYYFICPGSASGEEDSDISS